MSAEIRLKIVEFATKNDKIRALRTSYLSSVKPFKSKNRDKIDLDATNPNLKKKVVIEILERQPNLSYYVLNFADETLYLTNPHNL